MLVYAYTLIQFLPKLKVYLLSASPLFIPDRGMEAVCITISNGVTWFIEKYNSVLSELTVLYAFKMVALFL